MVIAYYIEWSLELLSKLLQEWRSQYVLVSLAYTENNTKKMQCFVVSIVFNMAFFSRT